MKTAIITPDPKPDSSTFITALREAMPAGSDYLYGGGIPAYSYYNGYILTPNIADKIKYRLQKFEIKIFLFEKYLINQNITTIIAQYGITASIVLESCKKLGIKLITHFHGFDAYEHKILNEYKSKYQEVFAYSSAIIAVSYAMKKQLIQLGAPAEKIIYNPCAPNNAFYLVQPNYNSDFLISIGRFVDKKAPYFTLLAFSQTLKICPNLKLKLIGDGPLLNTCINLAEYLGIYNSVIFLGNLSQEEVLKEIADAFGYIQHSIVAVNGDSEGTPVAVMEAGAAALPVISTIHAGIPEVHINGKTALLSAEKDVNAMASNIIFLANNRSLAKELGEAGRKHIRENYSMEKYVNKIINLL